MTNIIVTLQTNAHVHCNTHEKKAFEKLNYYLQLKLKCACLDSPVALLAFVWNNRENRRTSVSVYLCMSMCEWVAKGCLHLCVRDYLCAKQRTCLQVWVDAQVGREYFVCSLEWMQTLTDRSLFRWRSGCGKCATRTFVYFGVLRLSDGCAGLFGDQVINGHLRSSWEILSFLFTL